MRRILHITGFIVLLLAGFSSASGQNYFRVIDGVPHLPVRDPASVVSPEPGMLIYSTTDFKPMIYTGTGWDSFCTNTINATSSEEYFVVKKGIPCLPSLNNAPMGSLKPGTVYYSVDMKAFMVYNGGGWNKLAELVTGNFTESSGFTTGLGVKTCKLPVLKNAPIIVGLSVGAIYLNSSSKSLKYYDGTSWKDVECHPVVKTLPVSDLAAYTAMGGSEVLANGGSPVTLTGICWSTNSDPDTSSALGKTRITTTGPGLGVFPSQLTDLLPKTTYYVRAYAVNDKEIVYGENIVFTTPIAPPTIITLPADSITSIRARSGGDITSDGGAPVTKRGIIWSDSRDPVNDPSHIITDDGSGVGIYPSTLDGLLGNTTYYIRAYAVNAAGKAYGNLVEFTTPPPVPPVLNPAITLTGITGSSATGTALILNNGGAVVTERGICYSTDGVNYTYVPSSTVTPTDIGTFVTDLTGLAQGTTYYVKGYAKNIAGIGYSSETSFITASSATIITKKPGNISGSTAMSGGDISNAGFSFITARGICWDTTKTPTVTLATRTSDPVTGDGTGSYNSRMVNLLPGVTYYVRAYAVNAAGTAYGNLDSLVMPDVPKVKTSAASFYQNTTITGGNVLSDGGAQVTERGICWSKSANPVVSGSHTSDGDGLGLFTSLITGLTPNVTYHIRAYARNSVGVGYGEDVSFMINPDAPVIITLDISDTTSMSAVSGGHITSRGSAVITMRGIMFSSKGDPATDPDARTVTNDGSGEGIFPSKMDNLLGNTTYYVRAYAANVYGKSLGDLKVFTTLPPILPAVFPPSFDIGSITNTSADGEFLVKNNGGDPVTERGIRYTTDRVNYIYVVAPNHNPTDIGTFMAKLTGLTPNTTYYAQAYAVNTVGMGLSAENSFRTTSLAVLRTLPPENVTGFDAYSGGEIFSTGDDVIEAKGVCWGTEKNPAVDLPTKTSEALSGVGTGIYSSHITGLTPGVKYYIRAYAINSFGVAYGNLDSLVAASTASIMTTPATSITNTTAMTGGHIANDGSQPVTSRGVCWSTSPGPSIADSYISNGAGAGSYAIKLSGLMGSTKYYIRAYAINSVGIAYGNLDSFKTAPPVIPTVTTTDVINIGGVSALGRGNVTGNGGALVSERGFCWNTTGNPDTSGAHAAYGMGTGAFSGTLYGLMPNTKYYVRAYAINDVGVSYGNEITFSTFTIATILTLPADQITSTNARSGGNIISDGGALVTESGICWNTTGNPNVYDLHTSGGVGIGQFLHSIGNLMGSTTYYVRAYAINNAGIAYGQVETFITAPPVIPTLTTSSGRSGVSGTTAICGGIIVSNGGAVITTEGIVYSTVSGFIPDTVVTNKTVQSGSGNFTSTLKNLKPGTTYYARAYSINSAGIAYASNEVSFTTFDIPVVTTLPPDPSTITSVGVKTGGSIISNGGTDIIESGICWSTGDTPTIAGEHLSNGPGSGSFTRTITELMGSTTYYIRAYATNSVGTAYGQVESFTTRPPVLATIVTTQPVATSSTRANSGGTIVSHGGSPVTTRGIVWSTERNFNPDTVVQNRTAQTGYYTGKFTADMTGLTPATVYYVRAYVVNGVGVAYGEEMSFKTPTLASITTAYASANGPTKATSGGNITDNGGAEISSRGVLWSTDPNFDPDTVVYNRTNDGGGSGSFVSRLTGLKGNTTYYIMAYARNIAGVSYGNLLSFITDPPTLATLTTREAWNVYGLTATSGGHIPDDGGEPVTTRGVVWSTTKGFRPDTVVNNKTIQTGAGIGYFTSGMTGLSRGTTYYVRAYAVNSVGIAYASNEISFTTLDLPKLTTMPALPSSTGYSASSGGVLLSDGGTSVTNQGVCWSTSPNPTTGLYTKTTYDNWSGNNFHSSLTGLDPVTKYYVRAYAVNNQGTAYGNEVSFTTPPALPTVTTSYATAISKSSVLTGGQVMKDGGAAVTQRGVIWSTDPNFNPDTVVVNKTVDGSGTGKFNSTVTNMTMSISYYIRAYATNSAGTAYGNQVTITIFPTAPVLNTIELTDVTGTSVKTGGEITSDGGAPVTLKGMCWATHTNPTVDDSRTYNGDGTDTWKITLSGLKPNTLYYVRAYAVNKIGTAYGIERTFQTNGIPTLTATRPVTDIIATTATGGGEVTDDGRSKILSRGIVWSIYSNPDVSLSTKTVDTTVHTIGSFLAKMKGLSPNTTYYVRAYATNAVGTGYGSQVQFTTLPVMLPTLITVPPFAVDSVKATSGGDITDDGGMPILSRGIIWGIGKNLDINTLTRLTNSVSDTGYYTNQFAGLSPGTKYYVKAFAVNNKGTAYGNLDSLVTKAVRATVSNVVMSNLTDNSGDGTAAVVTDGGAEVTERGLCWNTSGNPTIANDTIRAGAGKGSFTTPLKGLNDQSTYYVRAYAINSAGIAYSPVVTSFRICPSAFDVIHVEGLNGAPVSKTVTYHSVSSNISGKAACWLTQNLGADKLATGATDATESAAGWYWQYNRIQGYQYTTARYPLAWVSSITEDSDWKPENDPCRMLIGTGWRIPTTLEWTNADGAPQNWNNYTNTFNSELKLHAAGYLDNGGLVYRGSTGEYWTSNQASTANGGNIGFNSTVSYVHSNPKARYAFSLRCIRDSIEVTIASVSNVVISDMTNSSINATATVAPDGGAEVTERGFCWNTTGDPVMTDNQIPMGAGTGSFISPVNGLKEGPTYYIRAYAINSQGTSYSPVVTSFKICPPEFTVQHVEGLNGAPVSKTVTYHSVSAMYSGAARCWITQNLGADQQATAVNDATEASAGWYWQFNRSQGYKYATGRTPATAWTSLTQTSDWSPENDPCNLLLGAGWRIPTSTEFANVIANGGIPFTTPLKLHYSGYLNYADGSLAGRGTYGIFWSSTATAPTTANYLQFSSGANANYSSYKWHGFTLRCLRDTVVLSKPSVSKVAFSEMTSSTVDATATVTPDGGSPVTERGFCWNTTGDPTTSDNKIAAGDSLGTFIKTLTGLKEGPTYYVRAYATNSIGTGYSPESSSFKICPPEFTIQHIAGIDGAAVTKKVTYHSVSSTLSGQAACWLTQNLGADQQAASLADATDVSAGWYWQFNRTQAYQYDGTLRTPLTGWISINETGNWTSATDPCTSLLGSGWRIPTSTEWTNVISNGGLPFATSPLKLHYSGYLNNTTGVLAGRGTQGNFWSSVQTNTTAAYDLPVYSSANPVLSHDKAYAFSVRCLRDSIKISIPSVGDVRVDPFTMTATSANASAAIGSDGGAPVTARGFCWNTTGNPTLADHVMTDTDGGTGAFTGKVTGLKEGETYYIRAYATNSAGTAYSDSTGFNAVMTVICPASFDIQHTAGVKGAPVTKKVTYHATGTYMTGAARCWITQNLGADREATTATDGTEPSAGWYFQFNRMLGYQHTGSVRTPVAWLTSINEASDWTPVNDPCNNMLGVDWRMPTYTEWLNADAAPQNWNTHNDAYNSVLKLHNAGYLAYNTGALGGRGTQGNYWSSTRNSATAGWDLQFYNAGSAMVAHDKAYGFSVRCLRDAAVKMPPTLSNVVISTTTMTDSTAEAIASIVTNGGSPVTARGIVWNTTGNPTINDNRIPSGSTDSTFNGIIEGLKEGPTYYVRAYAENSIGLNYSPQVTTFRICPQEFEILHSAGFNGVPVTKKIKYHSVNSTLSGAASCWLTQNLGADQVADAATNTSEASAGWYWQFNRIQGYKHDGSILTPNVGWVAAINENSNWTSVSDPCRSLLSTGWRIPTATEWTNAVASGGWGAKNAYTSELKLHYGGQLKSGALVDRGSYGMFWSATQASATTGSYLEFSAATGTAKVASYSKADRGWSLRCIREDIVITPPAVSNVTIIKMTDSVAVGTATVTPDGGAPVTKRGLVWNATGNPTINDNVVEVDTTGLGDFTAAINGLEDGRTYYVRAFATNSAGTGYSALSVRFKICKPIDAIHVAGLNGAPENKIVKYEAISTEISGSLMCWLAQNLGSDRQAAAVNDNTEPSAGWYWQFNRAQGYKHDGTSYSPKNGWTAWTTSISE
ncbi:fibrobacter succinogenes major paralogous domain-containing protein, partial [Pararcticibacter amylolyticus]